MDEPSSMSNSSPRYRGQPNTTKYPAGPNEHLVYCPLSGETQLLSNLKVQLADRCQSFATLDEHAARLCTELGYGPLQISATRKILGELADSGLLISHDDLCKRLLESERSSDSEQVPSISSLGIPTRNRAEILERCLRSFADCARLFDREMTFVVADQSVTDEAQTNLQMLASLKRERGIKIFYAGVEEKRQFVEHVSTHSGIAKEVVGFALSNDDNFPVDTGINRNALLLSTLDQLTLHVDDDSICRVTPCPDTKQGLVLETKYSPEQYWFPSEDELKSLGNDFAIEDIFALHEKLLGQPLRKCAEEFSSAELDLDRASANFVRKFERQPGKVVATSIGVAGDSGSGSSHFYLGLDGEERARLVHSESAYRFSLMNHQIIRAVSRATISDAAVCSGVNLGLDNRGLLPPFLPVQRAQDCVFSNLLHACLVSGYTGFLPWAVLHRRSKPWEFSEEELRKRVLYRWSGEIIEWLIRGLGPRPNRHDDRLNMVAVGQSLREWGMAPLADFEDMLRNLIWKEMSIRIAIFRHLIAKYGGQPRFWCDDIKRALSWLDAGFADDQLVVAEDLSSFLGVEGARIAMQLMVRRFGELVKAWPGIRDSACQLKSRGVFLTRAID